jgi:hypothetical protein
MQSDWATMQSDWATMQSDWATMQSDSNQIKSNNIYCLSQTVTINNSPLLHHKLYIPIIKLGFTIFKDSKQLNIPSGM